MANVLYELRVITRGCGRSIPRPALKFFKVYQVIHYSSITWLQLLQFMRYLVDMVNMTDRQKDRQTKALYPVRV